MQVYYDLESYPAAAHTVATIGTFDGLHLGHKAILQRLKDVAAQIGGISLLMSFHPHPRKVLGSSDSPLYLLQSLDEKIEALRDFGIDRLLLVPFSREFAATTSQSFIEDILVGKVQIDRLVIGYDHHFGKNRSGDIHELRAYALKHHYLVEEIPAQAIEEASVSSTRIRNALLEGKVALANSYLGYGYPLSGVVVHGEKQGRLLGYPTANIQVSDNDKLIPANGIYCVEVWLQGRRHYGMMSIGHKPTMGEFERGIEVNIFDFDEDIYGQDIKVVFLAYIRPEMKFDSWEALIAAIDGDKAFCMDFLKKLG